MKLIPEARRWWRMFSMRALAVIATLQGIVLTIPADTLTKPALGTTLTWMELNAGLTIAAAVIGGIGRLVAQPKVTGRE